MIVGYRLFKTKYFSIPYSRVIRNQRLQKASHVSSMEPITRPYSVMTSLQRKFKKRDTTDVSTAPSRNPISVKPSLISTLTDSNINLQFQRTCQSKLQKVMTSRTNRVHATSSESGEGVDCASHDSSAITCNTFAITESSSRNKLNVKAESMTTAM